MKAERESRCPRFPPRCSSPPQRSPLQALSALSIRDLPSSLFLHLPAQLYKEPAALPKPTGKKTQLM